VIDDLGVRAVLAPAKAPRARPTVAKTSGGQRIVDLIADRHAEAHLRRARDGTAPDPKGVHMKLYLLRHPAGLAAFLTFAAFDAAYRLMAPASDDGVQRRGGRNAG
jgi:hypothetical protein